MEDNKLLYSVPDSMKALDISRTKIYDLFKTGQLRPVRIGSRTFVTRAELERFVSSLTAA